MSEEATATCARPTGGPVGQIREEPGPGAEKAAKQESKMIRVRKKASDFVAPAYHRGESTSVKLSDHLGKWVVLCFYPGDFTFV